MDLRYYKLFEVELDYYQPCGHWDGNMEYSHTGWRKVRKTFGVLAKSIGLAVAYAKQSASSSRNDCPGEPHYSGAPITTRPIDGIVLDAFFNSGTEPKPISKSS